MPQPAPLLCLKNHQSLRERIVNRLRDAIIAGDLRPKSRLMEPELARRLGVSRTPLREGIRQLEAVGFLTTIRRVGTFVTEVTLGDVEGTYAIRCVLEGLAPRQPAESPDSAKADRLRSILAEMGRMTADYRQFHDSIFGLSGNQRLQAMYRTLTHQVARFRSLSLAVPQRPVVSFREHRRIAAAILEARGAEAERLMRAHIQGTQAVLRRHIGPAEEERRGR